MGTIAIVGLSTPGNLRVHRGPPALPSLRLLVRQNILLVIADDLGIEALERYQAEFGITAVTPATTPNINSLADNGVTFLSAWSNPMCTPTRAGILSGEHVFNHNLGHPKDVSVAGGGLESLEASLAGDPALPGMLLASYHSGLFGKWHLGGVGDPNAGCAPGGFYDSPSNLGWEIHEGSWEEISDPETYCEWETDEDGTCTELTTTADPSNYATTYVVDHALTWIDSVKSSPWFATVALNAPHDPLHEPTDTTCAACAAGSERTCFLDLVNSADTAVGDLVTGLHDNGELKDTMIIFVGDNGTAVGSAQLDGSGDPIPYPRGHWKSSVYMGGVHVPLIIADGCYLDLGTTSTECTPTLFQTRIDTPGRVEYALVHTLDLFATIINLNSPVVAPSTSRDSISLRPYLISTTEASREYLYTEGDRVDGMVTTPVCTIRDGRYQLIVDPCEETNASGCELYDLLGEDYGAESDDLLPGATTLPFALGGLVFEMQSLRGWGSHPCTDWVVP